MPICNACHKRYQTQCKHCQPNGDAAKPSEIVVATNEQLQRRSHVQRLAIATLALGHSRRVMINVIADVLYHYHGDLFWPDGVPYDLPEIDEVFGNDPTFRWVSAFLNFAVETPRQATQERVIERLRMIDLYFRIAHPDIAKRIAK